MALAPSRRRYVLIHEPDQEPWHWPIPDETPLSELPVRLQTAKDTYPAAKVFFVEITDSCFWIYSAERVIKDLRHLQEAVK